jgi:hypothetical protein
MEFFCRKEMQTIDLLAFFFRKPSTKTCGCRWKTVDHFFTTTKKPWMTLLLSIPYLYLYLSISYKKKEKRKGGKPSTGKNKKVWIKRDFCGWKKR